MTKKSIQIEKEKEERVEKEEQETKEILKFLSKKKMSVDVLSKKKKKKKKKIVFWTHKIDFWTLRNGWFVIKGKKQGSQEFVLLFYFVIVTQQIFFSNGLQTFTIFSLERETVRYC